MKFSDVDEMVNVNEPDFLGEFIGVTDRLVGDMEEAAKRQGQVVGGLFYQQDEE